MFSKKKNSSSSNNNNVVSTRKTYQQHSRKQTKDIEALRNSLLLKSFRQSAQQSTNQQLIYNIDTLVAQHNSHFALNTKENILISSQQQHLRQYYILSKHEPPNRTQPNIETNIVQIIRNKEISQFVPKPLPHYEAHIYPIMRHHTLKTKALRKKLQHQNGSTVSKYLKTWTKELPTLICTKDKEEQDLIKKSYKRDSSPPTIDSQSFQLKTLTECIKQMFEKQNAFRGELGVSKIDQNSWLQERRKSDSLKPMIDCDFSSIEGQSKFDLMIESRVKATYNCNEAEETYGLGELKRKYEEQRLSQLKQNLASRGIGHKRNPTEAPPCQKEVSFYDPLTPKEHAARSAFGSSKNIPQSNDKPKKSKSKDQSPYLLNFIKKTNHQHKTSNLKQNLKDSRTKKLKLQSKSKSKSRQKMLFKSGSSKAELKRL